MNKFKSVLFAAFALMVVMSSCNKSDVSPLSDDYSYVDFMFLATTADSTGKTHTGKKCSITEVEVASLPAAITSYVSTTYAGSTINKAGTTASGNYAVHVILADATHKGLIFDSAGKFLEERTKKGGKGGTRPEKVDVSTLPTSIPAYATANYAGSSIVFAFKGSLGGFGVLVKKADGTKVMLGFDDAGVFVAELEMKGKSRKGK